MDINGIKIEAAIFDLDGTIADSLDVWSHIDTEFFASHGITLPPDYQDAIKSMGFPQAASYTKQRFSLTETESEIVAQWSAMAEYEYAFNIHLKTGACEYLLALSDAGIKLGLATASGRELFQPLLKRHGVYDCFKACVTTTQAGKDKNHPDVYFLCAKELCCEPAQCIVYEDLLQGVLTAKTAGFKVAGVYDSRSALDQCEIMNAADCYIENFADALSEL